MKLWQSFSAGITRLLYCAQIVVCVCWCFLLPLNASCIVLRIAHRGLLPHATIPNRQLSAPLEESLFSLSCGSFTLCNSARPKLDIDNRCWCDFTNNLTRRASKTKKIALLANNDPIPQYIISNIMLIRIFEYKFTLVCVM